MPTRQKACGKIEVNGCLGYYRRSAKKNDSTFEATHLLQEMLSASDV